MSTLLQVTIRFRRMNLISGDRPKPSPPAIARPIAAEPAHVGSDRREHLLDDVGRVLPLKARLPTPSVHQRAVEIDQLLPGLRLSVLDSPQEAQGSGAGHGPSGPLGVAVPVRFRRPLQRKTRSAAIASNRTSEVPLSGSVIRATARAATEDPPLARLHVSPQSAGCEARLRPAERQWGQTWLRPREAVPKSIRQRQFPPLPMRTSTLWIRSLALRQDLLKRQDVPTGPKARSDVRRARHTPRPAEPAREAYMPSLLCRTL